MRFPVEQNGGKCFGNSEEEDDDAAVGDNGCHPHHPSPAEMTYCDEVADDGSQHRTQISCHDEDVHSDSTDDWTGPDIRDGAASHGHGGGSKQSAKESANKYGVEVLGQGNGHTKRCKQRHPNDNGDLAANPLR